LGFLTSAAGFDRSTLQKIYKHDTPM